MTQKWIGSVFLGLLLLGLAVGVGSEDKTAEIKWERYDSDGNNVKYFYDKESIQYPAPNILQVNRQRTFPKEALYSSIVTLDQIDCRKQKYRTIAIKVTNRDGSTKEFKKASEWAYIYVGMPEDYFLSEHCK